MTGRFLTDIVRRVREDVSSAEYEAGLPERRPAHPRRLKPAIESHRSKGAIVVEYKRASPGRADPHLPERSVSEFARTTAAADPAAYSCLATGPEFRGSPRTVAALVAETDRPVLFKEFVVDPRQVDVAARSGASAVLLIARLETEGLLDRPLSSLAEQARDLGLEVVLEFHRRAELKLAETVRPDVYGVNVRDLDSLAIDRPTAAATIAEAVGSGLRPLLGLSGVEGPEDAARLWSSGCDGLLVGSAVARAADPARFLASLSRTPGGQR